MQSNGKIVVAGGMTHDINHFALARFIGDTPPVPPHFSTFAWLKTIYAENLGYAPGECGDIVSIQGIGAEDF